MIVPISPMQIPMVGIFAPRIRSNIRTLSENELAMVAILTMSASSSAMAAWISSRLSGVPEKSWKLMIRLVVPYRGICEATSASMSTYSAPATIAERSSINRSCSLFVHRPPS